MWIVTHGAAFMAGIILYPIIKKLLAELYKSL